VIDWEIFRPILERIDIKERKSAAGRKSLCRVLMCWRAFKTTQSCALNFTQAL